MLTRNEREYWYRFGDDVRYRSLPDPRDDVLIFPLSAMRMRRAPVTR